MIWFLVRSTILLLLVFFIVVPLGSMVVSYISELYTAVSVLSLC